MYKRFNCSVITCCLALLLMQTVSVGASSGQRRKAISVNESSRLRKHLRMEFGFSLPVSAEIVRVASSKNKRVKFICIKMPVRDAVRFKRKLIDLRRPETQRFLHEDKDSDTHIGSLPVGQEPASIEAWQAENKFTGGETMVYIQNVKRIGESELKTLSYLVMFSQESRGLAYFYFYPAKR